jgi:UDP-N-acetylglucosamine transferase subunit ALG13
MIFVTVGTHEQQFNRLVEYMDLYAKESSEEVVMQIGYSTYKPKYCKYSMFYSYDEIGDFINRAHIVITHGGPSSFIRAVQCRKIPLVVTRKKEFGEHVNNHQYEFCKEIENRFGYIKVVYVEDLKRMITNYDEINNKTNIMVFNNENFCIKFDRIVEELFS